jgi:hypothetical protein
LTILRQVVFVFTELGEQHHYPTINTQHVDEILKNLPRKRGGDFCLNLLGVAKGLQSRWTKRNG